MDVSFVKGTRALSLFLRPCWRNLGSVASVEGPSRQARGVMVHNKVEARPDDEMKRDDETPGLRMLIAACSTEPVNMTFADGCQPLFAGRSACSLIPALYGR